MVNYRFSKERFQGESWVKRILSSPWFFIFSFVFLVLSIFPLVRSVGSLRFVLSQEKRLNQESVELALQESQAEGEKAAAENISLAAERLASTPGGLHLRTLQTLGELSADKNNTIVFVTPLEILRAFEGLVKKTSKQ